jgi:hypothetical protein
MPVNVPVTQTYLSFLGSMFTQIRDRLDGLDNQRAFINNNGGLAFLTAAQPDGLGMEAKDAAALIAALDQHHDLNVAYAGGPAPPVQDYRDNASAFWGGA